MLRNWARLAIIGILGIWEIMMLAIMGLAAGSTLGLMLLPRFLLVAGLIVPASLYFLIWHAPTVEAFFESGKGF